MKLLLLVVLISILFILWTMLKAASMADASMIEDKREK